MNKLFRLSCLSITLLCLLIVNAQSVSAKKSAKKSSRGKAAASSSKKSGKKVSSRKGSREVARRGGKKLSRRELAALSKKERRGRGRYSRRGRSYVARDSYQSRGEEALKIREEAPLHVGDEDPQPATSNNTTFIAPTAPAPAPRASGIPPERVMEIQNALLKVGYYQGEANGIYDENTKQAMKQYQQANNLQASGMPSAHALKKLGVAKRKNDDYAVPVKSAKNKDDNRNSSDRNDPDNQ
jgi:hypothetical protein